jgi:hypothetical protein
MSRTERPQPALSGFVHTANTESEFCLVHRNFSVRFVCYPVKTRGFLRDLWSYSNIHRPPMGRTSKELNKGRGTFSHPRAGWSSFTSYDSTLYSITVRRHSHGGRGKEIAYPCQLWVVGHVDAHAEF